MSASEWANVRHAQNDEGDNVRHVKKTKGIMSAYAVFNEGDNVRRGKCPVTHFDPLQLLTMYIYFILMYSVM